MDNFNSSLSRLLDIKHWNQPEAKGPTLIHFLLGESLCLSRSGQGEFLEIHTSSLPVTMDVFLSDYLQRILIHNRNYQKVHPTATNSYVYHVWAKDRTTQH